MIWISFKQFLRELKYAMGWKRYVTYTVSPPTGVPVLCKNLSTGETFWHIFEE